MKSIMILGLTLLATGCAPSAERTLTPLAVASLAVPPETVTVHIHNYQPQTGAQFQNLFVANFSVHVGQGQLQSSSSRDGLTDAFKNSLSRDYGFSAARPESAVAGFADLFLFKAGITASGQKQL